MKSNEDLKHLLALIDDESIEVRETIHEELKKYGHELEVRLVEYSNFLNADKYKYLNPILESSRRDWLRENYLSWSEHKDEIDQLENFMELLAIFQLGFVRGRKQKKIIDDLSDEFKTLGTYTDEIDLANFLFHEKNIQGSKNDYYNPLNSNLIYAVEQKQGLPITLSILLIILGSKFGFNIEGCNFPGHFLAKIFQHDEIILIDCFNGGRLIFENDLKQTTEDDSIEAILNIVNMKTGTKSIVRRVFANLINAYEKSGEAENKELIISLLI